jgi:hypothetical protein
MMRLRRTAHYFPSSIQSYFCVKYESYAEEMLTFLIKPRLKYIILQYGKVKKLCFPIGCLKIRIQFLFLQVIENNIGHTYFSLKIESFPVSHRYRMTRLSIQVIYL